MAEENEQWSCTVCTLMNDLTAEACEACGTTSPLVLESYATEEQAATMASALRTGSPKKTATRAPHGRAGSEDSVASTASDEALSREIAAELDPWSQAEQEWANVEAHQDSTAMRQRRK